MNNARETIIRPVVSEKSYALVEENSYTFIVHPDANKVQIRQAVEEIWDVKVLSVNTSNRKGKVKRTLKEKAYFYRPAVSRHQVVQRTMGDLIERMFGGSAERLVMSLVETRHLTPEKIARLRKLLEEEEEK